MVGNTMMAFHTLHNAQYIQAKGNGTNISHAQNMKYMVINRVTTFIKLCNYEFIFVRVLVSVTSGRPQWLELTFTVLSQPYKEWMDLLVVTLFDKLQRTSHIQNCMIMI